MLKVSDTHHLTRRGATWYFRRRVPEALVPIIGRSVIQCSLNTTDKKAARQRRELLDLEWSARFEAAEERRARPLTSTQNKPLTEATAVELVRNYVEKFFDTFRNELQRDPPASAHEQREMRVTARREASNRGRLMNPTWSTPV